jgi:hypothetical protein
VNRFEMRPKRRDLELQGSYFVQLLPTDGCFMGGLVWQTYAFLIILLLCLNTVLISDVLRNLHVTLNTATVALIPSIVAALFLILYDLLSSQSGFGILLFP